MRAEQPPVEVVERLEGGLGRVGAELVDRGGAERQLDPLDGLDAGGLDGGVDDGDGGRDDLGADAVAEQDAESVGAVGAMVTMVAFRSWSGDVGEVGGRRQTVRSSRSPR